MFILFYCFSFYNLLSGKKITADLNSRNRLLHLINVVETQRSLSYCIWAVPVCGGAAGALQDRPKNVYIFSSSEVDGWKTPDTLPRWFRQPRATTDELRQAALTSDLGLQARPAQSRRPPARSADCEARGRPHSQCTAAFSHHLHGRVSSD